MDYYAKFRTNHFRVKDRTAFLDWVETLPGVEPVRPNGPDDFNHFCLINDGSIPSHDIEDDEIDFPACLATHLEPEQVAIIMEIGSEGLRYLVGEAIAVDPSGDTITISLHDIYQKAAETFGVPISDA